MLSFFKLTVDIVLCSSISSTCFLVDSSKELNFATESLKTLHEFTKRDKLVSVDKVETIFPSRIRESLESSAIVSANPALLSSGVATVVSSKDVVFSEFKKESKNSSASLFHS